MENEVKELNKKIACLELANEGLLAEYQYVVEKKENNYKKIKEENEINIEKLSKEKEKKEYYEKEFEKAVSELEKYKKEVEAIKNSRWWKLREKIKGKKR